MARITSQEAAAKVGGQFDLVLVAAHRARELRNGHNPRVKTKNDSCVTALKEIEKGLNTKEEYRESFNRAVANLMKSKHKTTFHDTER